LLEKGIHLLAVMTAFTVAILVVLVVYDATVRYIFSGGSIALQELEWHLFDIIILFAISYTLQKDAHVRVDIFYSSFSEKSKALINMISSVVFIFPFSLLMIYLGLDFVALSFSQNECSSNPGGLEYRFLVKALLPLSFFFVVLQTFSSVKKDLKRWRYL